MEMILKHPCYTFKMHVQDNRASQDSADSVMDSVHVMMDIASKMVATALVSIKLIKNVISKFSTHINHVLANPECELDKPQ